MKKKQRTKKLKKMGKDNVYAKVIKDEIDAMKEKIKKETIENAKDMDQVKGARVALKYFDRLKRRIDRPSRTRDEDTNFLPSYE